MLVLEPFVQFELRAFSLPVIIHREVSCDFLDAFSIEMNAGVPSGAIGDVRRGVVLGNDVQVATQEELHVGHGKIRLFAMGKKFEPLEFVKRLSVFCLNVLSRKFLPLDDRFHARLDEFRSVAEWPD